MPIRLSAINLIAYLWFSLASSLLEFAITTASAMDLSPPVRLMKIAMDLGTLWLRRNPFYTNNCRLKHVIPLGNGMNPQHELWNELTTRTQ